ncbi:rhodanese (plasmid) [Sphingobium sp. SCG-1]|uniref:rhodanese-like domain-containing protein n=1 Tax=Sphingobium sp. SCG-1 TaxID=2072936 RepID=UPI000CD67F4D|nr:rhodanese-like domain-containing protein [Sphingobium sp. SCG-1]AUW60606.1 rhodanese [Sphingobium sp. SCG-1]
MLTLVLGAAVAVAGMPLTDGRDFDAVSGYRIAHYRSVVPFPPEGVRKIEVQEALELLRRQGALFVDVTPAQGGRRDALTGHWALAETHETIPGARWFPDAGRGQLEPVAEAWFLGGMARLLRGSVRPIVVFCLADCWMSWNASMRLRRAGYRDVRWFADGVDGWREKGLMLVNRYPEN